MHQDMEDSYIAFNLETLFKKGDRVVCIDDQFPLQAVPLFGGLPVMEEVYTVRDSFTQEGKKVILLDEITSDKLCHPMLKYADTDFYFEPAFSVNRFEREEDYQLKIWEEL